MESKAEIRREIEKLASEYTPEELFASPYFAEMLQATITSVCEEIGRIPTIKTSCDSKSSLTACTDGLEIEINTQGPLIKGLGSNWRMYLGNIGHVVHESGHVLFTDFEHQNRLLDGWLLDKEFNYYPKAPDLPNAKEVEDIMRKNPNLRNAYGSCMRYMLNVLEDAYVERRLYQNFDGLATAGLTLVNNEMYRLSGFLEHYLSECLEGECLPLQVVSEILLNRCVAKREMKSKELLEEEKELLEFIESVIKSSEEEITGLCQCEDADKRLDLANRLFVKMFELMPELEDEEPEDEEGNRDIDEQMLKEILESLTKQMQESGSSAMPKGDTSGLKDLTNPGCDQTDTRSSAEALAESEQSIQRELERAIKEAATKAVLAEDERRHAANLSKEARLIAQDIEKITRFSQFAGYSLKRTVPDKETYKEIYRSVQRTSINLSRKINNILKERETESSENGFMMGQHFNAKDVVNRDGKYFSRQFIPDGKPSVAFGILVDESGSMSCRGKYIKARRVAILLEDALRRLDIPLMVVGHTEVGCGDCTLHVYADFDTNDGMDCFRLSGITAEGGNIDGAAISYVGEKLLKRPEVIKVMIVISDGLPAGSSFYAADANTDTKLAAERYRKKGIEVLGAVVDQFEKVSEIYGEKYAFDCRTDGTLEKQLLTLIKKYVLLKSA